MTDQASRLPKHPSLEQLRKQAKELLRDFQDSEGAAVNRFRVVSPHLADKAFDEITLADAQFVLAREYGFENWVKLKQHIDVSPHPKLEPYERVAADIVLISTSDDADALQRIHDLIGRPYPYPDRRAQIQRHLTVIRGSESGIEDITLDDARLIVARRFGLESWAELAERVTQPPAKTPSAPFGMSATSPFYKIDWKEHTIELRAPISKKDWDTILGVIHEHQITGLNAGGQMTDFAMERVSQHNQIIRLDLGGSKKLTDAGLQHLARMPQLQRLALSGSRITDRGLEVLRDLPELIEFGIGWQNGISDKGVANLKFCDRLESVTLLGTYTGDGALEALAGKPKLRRFHSGRLVTDAGLRHLHGFPIFKTWHGGELKYSLMEAGAEPNHLLLDGPFTDKGFSSIAGLDGLFALTFFWHISELTANGLKPLAELPNLGFLGCQNELCNDDAMRHIAAIPRLRMLMGQGAVASDDGFVSLSRSKTIEYIWGRDCPNFGSRGFTAMQQMPSLKGLAISCKNVDDEALSLLPRFPALKGLMPMDVPDEGFRHIGRCSNLEDLWCMYCRDTGDRATEHLAGLMLKTYYAGATQITDRSLEILSRMATLERIEFYECSRISNTGLALLAGLPRLREITVGGSPNVTRTGMEVFSPSVRANYW